MSDPILDAALWQDAQKVVSADVLAREQAARIERIKAGAAAGHNKQLPFVLDTSAYESLRCPRRSGKSFGMALKAVLVGEEHPGARILIISLTLKSTKENYWSGSPSGIFTMDRLFNLGLKYNHTDAVWWHQNGSRGRLAGAETRADIEYLRGAAAEADIVLIDEGKSFAPGLLRELMRDVIEPGLMTRDGIVIMGGTPGLIPRGAFYEATCEAARITVELPTGELLDDGTSKLEKLAIPTCVPYERRKDPYYAETFARYEQLSKIAATADEDEEEAEADEPWSLHTWTVKDNIAWPKQWRRALRVKRRNKWKDDHPTWRREYLGEWVQDSEGMVYAFAALRDSGSVNWYPIRTTECPTGLPPEDGPWHLVMGLDIGFEDDTAIVLCGYSERVAELRHVADYKAPHMLADELATKLEDFIIKYGMPEMIVADTGGGGSKILVETLAQRYGLPMEAAKKTEKMDHIELVNADFHTGSIKIILGTDLDNELCGLQWSLEDGSKAELAHLGKLKEDPKCPNHLCDALLYLHRLSSHFWARTEKTKEPEYGTDAWLLKKEREEELADRADKRVFSSDNYPGLKGSRLLTRKNLWTLRN